eukprot:gene14933-17571_t
MVLPFPGTSYGRAADKVQDALARAKNKGAPAIKKEEAER